MIQKTGRTFTDIQSAYEHPTVRRYTPFRQQEVRRQTGNRQTTFITCRTETDRQSRNRQSREVDV